MSWRFRKFFNLGPLRFALSKRGVGSSIGIPGLRVGKSADGRMYISIGIPGTGIYMQKYLSRVTDESSAPEITESKTASNPKTEPDAMSTVRWWRQEEFQQDHKREK